MYGPDGNPIEEVIGGTTAFVSLSNESAVASGTPLNNQRCRSNHTMVVVAGTGVTAGAVQMQGSLDGVSWFNMGSAVSVSAAGVSVPVVASGQPVQYLRASITTAVTGGTVSASVASTG